MQKQKVSKYDRFKLVYEKISLCDFINMVRYMNFVTIYILFQHHLLTYMHNKGEVNKMLKLNQN